MVIFDASTLILLAKIELLNPFLASSELQSAIPAEVERECCGVKKTMDSLMIQKAVEESRIKVITVTNHKLVRRLQEDFSLGRGEGEAVALSLREKAQLLGIDDKNGINASKVLGIPFTITVGILVRSRDKGFLDHAEALARLAALARCGRYKNSIMEDAKRRLEVGK